MYHQSDCMIMFCQIVLILSSIGAALCDFMPVADDCKYWSYLKIYGNGGKKHLHCILDQNFQPGLVYADTKLISNGTCPIYNRYAKQVDSIPCNENIGKCPKQSIPSYIGVTYSGCYEAIRKHTNMITPTRTEDRSSPPTVPIKHTNVITPTRTEDRSSPPTVPINNSNQTALVVISAVLAIVLCMNMVVFVRYYMCRPKPCRGAKERSTTEEVEEVIFLGDTQDRFVTKEGVEAMIFDGTQDRFVTKKEVQAMIIDDTQDRFVTKEEVKTMIFDDTIVRRQRSEGIDIANGKQYINTYIPSSHLM